MRRLAALLLPLLLQGCAGALVAGGAAGATAASERRSLGTLVEDQAIELRLMGRLAREPALKGTRVSVTSVNRLVLLTGQVATEAQRRRAEALAAADPEVRRVHDALTLGPPASLQEVSRDSLITGRVKTALLGAQGLGGVRVKVVTEQGVVYLLGVVRPAEARAAVATARQVRGVRRVVDLLERRP
ncbi:MAG: BON domain-containing protein [Gammaproteobacteria bacterium]|nr:MAG: BON domain-containing protein [Gammaproteobacteria bacterium]